MKIKLETFEDVKRFIEITDKYSFDVDVSHNNYVVDGKSLMGILSIGLSKILVVEPQGFVDSNSPMKDEFYRELDPWKVA